jgi:formylglycine-generating enzyme required for sulfatase activity
VESVSWEDVKAYLIKLNEKGLLPEGWKFALPTEAQWEYACRAGEKGPYSGGSLDEVGWHAGNSEEKTHEVGLKKPNSWGLHDMHGNVAEWCDDEFSLELTGGKDPVGSDCDSKWGGRVVRGCSFCVYGLYDNQFNEWRAAMRHFECTDVTWANIGFRVAIVQSE